MVGKWLESAAQMDRTPPSPRWAAARSLATTAVFVLVGSLLLRTLGEQFLSLFGCGLRWHVPWSQAHDQLLALLAFSGLLLRRAATFGVALAVFVPVFSVLLVPVAGGAAAPGNWLPLRWLGTAALGLWLYGSASIGVIALLAGWRRPQLARTASVVLLAAVAGSALRFVGFHVRAGSERVELADGWVACDRVFLTPFGGDLLVEIWREWPLGFGCCVGQRVEQFASYSSPGQLQVRDGAAVLVWPGEADQVVRGPWR